MNDIYYTYFLLFLLILSFLFNPFIKKKVIEKMNSHEYLLFNHFLITMIIIIYGIYLLSYGSCDFNCLKKLNYNDILWAILAGITTVIGSIVFIILISREEITFIMPNVQPIVILLGAVIGYYLFDESMHSIKVFGIVLIVLGAFMINYDKFNKINK
jgi:uncharacterized membrane protein